MKKNMGSSDRIIRIIIALVIVLLFAMHTITGTTAIVLLTIAAIFLLTSFISFCPLYSIFKIKTNK